MQTYTLEQIDQMGWMPPEKVAELNADLANAIEEVAELVEHYNILEERIRQYEEEFARERLINNARMRSLEQAYQRFARGEDDPPIQ